MVYNGIKALVMGLGLHGGGLETARFLLKRGADVTVTDLRDEKTLQMSIEKLDSFCTESGLEKVRYILGKHETCDFKNADIVIKNPGVRPDSPFLKEAKHIETDISLFLSASPARLYAVTGTKGKSSTASALHWILQNCRLKNSEYKGKALLGGNITVSPLSFIDELNENDDVVLELSSFQLGDLKGRRAFDGSALLKPAACVITPVMRDHLDRYASMEEYIDDKRTIYRGQDQTCVTAAGCDRWGESFLSETKGRPLVYSSGALKEGQSGGWLEKNGGVARLLYRENAAEKNELLVPEHISVEGEHQKLNLLAASLLAYSTGYNAEDIHSALLSFKGIEHRLEFFHESKGVRFYNDSAATIPEAAAACIEALSAKGNLVLVTGGTDKNLDFSVLVQTAAKAKSIILLAGSGSEEIAKELNKKGISYSGPFDNLDRAVSCAAEKAHNGDIVALSPGCASFGMFLNEFDRGRKWKEAVIRIAG